MSHKRMHVFYSGHVQGVGFRFTARNVASRMGLTGWVKNLRDSKVELVCEGEEKDIKSFLSAINDEFSGHYIVDTDITWERPTQEFKNFDIRF